jgi:hypothetical protein
LGRIEEVLCLQQKLKKWGAGAKRPPKSHDIADIARHRKTETIANLPLIYTGDAESEKTWSLQAGGQNES